MRCDDANRLVLTPTLLGRDGLLRAFTLVTVDRSALTLAAWIAETETAAPRHDRRILGSDTDSIPPRGLVGLIAPTGCLFAVFAYAAEPAAPRTGVLAIRGPSWSAPLGGRLVPERIEETMTQMAAALGCSEIRRTGW